MSCMYNYYRTDSRVQIPCPFLHQNVLRKNDRFSVRARCRLIKPSIAEFASSSKSISIKHNDHVDSVRYGYVVFMYTGYPLTCRFSPLVFGSRARVFYFNFLSSERQSSIRFYNFYSQYVLKSLQSHEWNESKHTACVRARRVRKNTGQRARQNDTYSSGRGRVTDVDGFEFAGSYRSSYVRRRFE